MVADRKRVNRYQLSAAGAVSKLSMYLLPTSTGGTQVLKGVIYADNAGSPGALVGVSSELSFASTQAAGWYDLRFVSPVSLAAGNYWLGVISGGSSNVAGFRYASVSGSRAFNPNSYSSGPSSPFGSASTDGEQMSIYATYTPNTTSPPAAPVNSGLPVVSGTAQQGQVLSASTGTWTNNPSGFAYQWLRCAGSCSAIAGATAQTYTVVGADVGGTLEVTVTASNSGGSGSATSAPTATVQAASSTATFGTSTVGSGSDTMRADRKRVNRYQLVAAGAVSKLSMYLVPTSTGGTQVLKGLIYADNAGSPGALLGVSSELSFSSSQAAGWYDLRFASPVSLAAGNYWLGVISGGTSYVAGFRFAIVSGSRVFNANSYGSGPSSPFGSASTDGEQMSIYATYTTFG
jgi:hypothetical protein